MVVSYFVKMWGKVLPIIVFNRNYLEVLIRPVKCSNDLVIWINFRSKLWQLKHYGFAKNRVIQAFLKVIIVPRRPHPFFQIVDSFSWENVDSGFVLLISSKIYLEQGLFTYQVPKFGNHIYSQHVCRAFKGNVIRSRVTG